MGPRKNSNSAIRISARTVAFALLATLGVLRVFLHPVTFDPASTTHIVRTDIHVIAVAHAFVTAVGVRILLATLQRAYRLQSDALSDDYCLDEPALTQLRC
jgi:hypothetical protein